MNVLLKYLVICGKERQKKKNEKQIWRLTNVRLYRSSMRYSVMTKSGGMGGWRGSESLSVMSDSLRPHGILQARILEWVAVPFSRRIFPTQGLNPDWLHCRQILYQQSYQGSPSRGQRYVYFWLIHIVVWQKLVQYCKAIVLQLKINFKK